jgi:hypothetical protein
MREFGKNIDEQERAEIIRAARDVFDGSVKKRAARASEFALEIPGDPIMVNEVDVRWEEGRLRVAMTTEEAHPMFEWLIEITANMGEVDYFKHYLVLEDDVVLAQRKVLTPIDSEEAAVVLADLALAAATQ